MGGAIQVPFAGTVCALDGGTDMRTRCWSVEFPFVLCKMDRYCNDPQVHGHGPNLGAAATHLRLN